MKPVAAAAGMGTDVTSAQTEVDGIIMKFQLCTKAKNKVVENLEAIEDLVKIDGRPADEFKDETINILGDTQASQDLLKKASALLEERKRSLSGVVQGYTDYLVYQIKENLGKCHPAYTMYASSLVVACDGVVHPFTGFWFCVATYLAIGIPAMFMALFMSTLYSRKPKPKPKLPPSEPVERFTPPVILDAYPKPNYSTSTESVAVKPSKKTKKKKPPPSSSSSSCSCVYTDTPTPEPEPAAKKKKAINYYDRSPDDDDFNIYIKVKKAHGHEEKPESKVKDHGKREIEVSSSGEIFIRYDDGSKVETKKSPKGEKEKDKQGDKEERKGKSGINEKEAGMHEDKHLDTTKARDQKEPPAKKELYGSPATDVHEDKEGKAVRKESKDKKGSSEKKKEDLPKGTGVGGKKSKEGNDSPEKKNGESVAGVHGEKDARVEIKEQGRIEGSPKTERARKASSAAPGEKVPELGGKKAKESKGESSPKRKEDTRKHSFDAYGERSGKEGKDGHGKKGTRRYSLGGHESKDDQADGKKRKDNAETAAKDKERTDVKERGEGEDPIQSTHKDKAQKKAKAEEEEEEPKKARGSRRKKSTTDVRALLYEPPQSGVARALRAVSQRALSGGLGSSVLHSITNSSVNLARSLFSRYQTVRGNSEDEGPSQQPVSP
ncbi:pre-mRNA-splicing factor CWC22 homolog [Dermacentor silvarum]|uniref:pre-mRNA-splicing factor CWC22 homolog n=1 Tax=Dermacentor silvarum TaxID=543639 RepID=UPI0021014F0E|nr:pre-mRNA-splicing factor CWC22 homolog [Dermacentor silvarum]